jgi:hypothetical protein
LKLVFAAICFPKPENYVTRWTDLHSPPKKKLHQSFVNLKNTQKFLKIVNDSFYLIFWWFFTSSFHLSITFHVAVDVELHKESDQDRAVCHLQVEKLRLVAAR